MKVQLLNAPKEYFQWLEKDIRSQLINGKAMPDLVQIFAASFKELESAMKKLIPVYKANPGIVIWLSWFKKSAGVATDLTEDVIREWPTSK